ncbi:hypothetical protein PENSPDRAFT_672324 [Peniophora sp. CONT]|nr:hypothetical protein PENSPDRAFT_672324 [Peniophora sp. CONT]
MSRHRGRPKFGQQQSSSSTSAVQTTHGNRIRLKQLTNFQIAQCQAQAEKRNMEKMEARMAAVAALIEAGANPQTLQDLSNLGFDFNMSDVHMSAVDGRTGEESDEEFARIREENNSVLGLVDAVGKVLGPRKLKRYIRFITGRGRFWASVSRRTRLERMHASFQEALPDMVPVYMEWERRRSNVSPDSNLNTNFGREMKLRVVNYAVGAHNELLLRIPDGENVNVTLMRHGYIGGTPITPAVAFHLDILCLAHSSRRCNPSCGLQGIIRMICMFHEITHSLALSFRQAFDIYLDLLKRVESRVNKALGRGPDFQARLGCPACGYTDADNGDTLSPARLHAMDGCDSHKDMRGAGTADPRIYDSAMFLDQERVDRHKDEALGTACCDRAAISAPASTDIGADADADEPQVDEAGFLRRSDHDPCGQTWKAANGKEMTPATKEVLEQSGIFTVMCRHGLVEAIIEMVGS